MNLKAFNISPKYNIINIMSDASNSDFGLVIAAHKFIELSNLINSANFYIKKGELSNSDINKFHLYRYAILDYNACYDYFLQIVYFAFDFYEPIKSKEEYKNQIKNECVYSKYDNKTGERYDSVFMKNIKRVKEENSIACEFFNEYNKKVGFVSDNKFGIKQWANNIKHQGGFRTEEMFSEDSAFIECLDDNGNIIFTTKWIYPFIETFEEVEKRLQKQNEHIVNVANWLFEYIYSDTQIATFDRKKKFSADPNREKVKCTVMPYNIIRRKVKAQNIRKYWWVIFLIVILLPIGLNFILQIPRFAPIVGDDTNWLTFWSGYLGAIVSAGVAFFVLHRQLKQSHEENERNRKLQLKTFQYQQQMQWLNNMRKACIENIHAYDINQFNTVVEIVNTDPYKAFCITKDIMANLAKTDTNVAFLGEYSQSNFCKEFHDKRSKSYSQIINAAMDIHYMISYVMELKTPDYRRLADKMLANKNITDDMRSIIKKSIIEDACYFPNDIIKRVKLLSDIYEQIRNYTQQYLNNEQKRINEILTKE